MNAEKVTIEENTKDSSNSTSAKQSLTEPRENEISTDVKKTSLETQNDASSDPKLDHMNEMELPNNTEQIFQDTPVYKDEPSDVDMDLAEDFTKNTAYSTGQSAVPTINNKTSYQEQIATEQATESQAVLQIANSSLSLLSQYISSDSESNITDSEEELPRVATQSIKQEAESDDSEDCVEVVENQMLYRSQRDSIVVSDVETAPSEKDNQSDEDCFSSGEESLPPVPIKGKGETLIHELPPIQELQISVPEAQCKSIGYIQSVVAQIVIVQSHAGVELLNIDTVLFLEKGKRSLGKIFDVIGQVAAPMYCVLFNSRQEVTDKGITIGAPVFCAPQTEHTQFIILSELMKHKGSDASWLDDTEAPEYALDYSDDEQERRVRNRRNSHNSTGRQTPDREQHNRVFHRRTRGRGNTRGRQNGHSWHHNIHQSNNPQRVINPFAYALSTAGMLPPPPPPPAPPTN
ncbi:H/ACA ribonucleoprotein complex non-core subunit NAF1 [Wyeomyia smithii]|uniref:H/ACA ribonucleoprotein complex non-core subunit NAF1 n=1 Tax=Wyeomyia smithii TaxID=174621 RepID=UPI0024680551|nr:H/ACA ribonucleoprotein complex non-core subunit NAF1 [Wyeomyia smithii]